jgi:hypothetical protein
MRMADKRQKKANKGLIDGYKRQEKAYKGFHRFINK